MKAKTILAYAIFLLVLVASTSIFVWYLYTQKYVQDGEHTATTGIIWTTTLNLTEYKRVSSGVGVWGKFDRYSRSDRHNDVLTIYCNEYCHEK